MSRGIFMNINWGLLAPVGILVVLSLTTLISINITFFKSQIIYLILSLVAFFFFSQVHHKAIQLYAYPIYIFSVIALFVVLFIGLESRGAVRWLDIFGLRIQFSEITKPLMVLFFSSFLANRSLSLKNLIMIFFFLFPVIFLIYMQPDLGNALIYLLATILTMVILGFRFIWFILGFLFTTLISPVVWHFLYDYQKQRILNFIYPNKDPLGTSYNAIQSIIAVGSGGFLGKGFSETTQSGLRFLPEKHTDFIFATISEGLGFLGAVIIIACFIILLFRIFHIFYTVDDNFYKIFAAFSFSFILIQFFTNIGMNIGLLPIVGVTLPFVSYGGSSLLSYFILLGLLSSSNSILKQKETLEIR